MAALFASRGVRCTILTTPVNAAVIRSVVDQANDASRGTGAPVIDISTVPFPDVGLPPGVESVADVSSEADILKSLEAVRLLPEPFNRFLAEHHPDAAIVNSFYSWAAEAAAEHGIPPGRRHRQQLLFVGSRSRRRARHPAAAFPWDQHVEHYRTVLGRRVWLIGPVALAANKVLQAASGGVGGHAPDANRCLRWLDEKPGSSVMYISFGTLAHFMAAELREVACGLQRSGRDFLWVVTGEETDASRWMPEGFAELVDPDERGIIFRGWAPQRLILSHSAVGAFVTHCGWNSVLALSAGVPLVTWPRHADQFYNEKLLVEVLKVGVGVGSGAYASKIEDRGEVISGQKIAKAIDGVMGDGEQAEEIRKKAIELRAKAWNAIEKGGSSYDDVQQLINEYKDWCVAHRALGVERVPISVSDADDLLAAVVSFAAATRCDDAPACKQLAAKARALGKDSERN
ncbi:hypothetical protein HU200_005414 [Digitaria exilis]|uniref:Glycosyltransferase n=1 Tax=Digitaria exilis TaxID=1010633 RepID=A0A835FSY7_9POAL|nr:hypothetical protein HU200_005414 [Digitaria exilis]